MSTSGRKDMAMRMEWRFLFHEGPSSLILATEEVLTRSVGEGLAPPTVRVNVFRPASVLVGYHQCVGEEVDVEEAKKAYLDINRRCTGGGTIIMYDDTPGWEIWVPEKLSGPSTIEESIEYLSRPMVGFFRLFGIDARFRPKNDIEVKGKKLSGIGQYRSAGGVLHCGTMLLDFDIPLMLRVLKLPMEKISDKAIRSFEERITTVKREIGYKPSLDEVIRAFKSAVEEDFNVKLRDGDLNDHEREDLEGTIRKYQSKKWIYESRSHEGYTNAHVVKTPGGLLRAHVKVFRGVIESVLLTGDFFAYPSNAIYDLEARLKWCRADEEEVKKAVKEFFAENDISMLGLTPNDTANAICMALRR